MYTRFFNRGLVVFLSVIFLVILCSCAQGDNISPTEPSLPDSPTELLITSTIPSAPVVPIDTVLNAYKSVLQGKADFCEAYDKKNMRLSQFYQTFNADGTHPTNAFKFAVIDLDFDGIPEVVLWLLVGGLDNVAFEVLRYHDGVVYGYMLYYRSFSNIKEDGTFSFSSNAGNGGFGTLEFTDNDCSIKKITYAETDMSSPIYPLPTSYFVNYESSTEAAFNLAIKEQNEKADATWYDFTDDNIESVLSIR